MLELQPIRFSGSAGDEMGWINFSFRRKLRIFMPVVQFIPFVFLCIVGHGSREAKINLSEELNKRLNLEC